MHNSYIILNANEAINHEAKTEFSKTTFKILNFNINECAKFAISCLVECNSYAHTCTHDIMMCLSRPLKDSYETTYKVAQIIS